MNLWNLARRLAVACATALLASCATQPPAQDNKANYRIDASSDRGAAVFGLAIEKPFPWAHYYFIEWTCYDPASGAICPERDPNSERNMFGVPQRILGWGAGIESGWFESDEPLKQPHYFVMIMPPGDYILTEFVSQQNSRPQTRVTVFANRGKPAAESSAPRFSVEAGKVVYIGDYIVDADRTPVRIRISRNAAAARAALAEYPNIKGELTPAALRTKD